jgi:hypothetical protein
MKANDILSMFYAGIGKGTPLAEINAKCGDNCRNQY